jgi:hypothetical protein
MKRLALLVALFIPCVALAQGADNPDIPNVPGETEVGPGVLPTGQPMPPAIDEPADGECYTYDNSSGVGEWAVCAGGGSPVALDIGSDGDDTSDMVRITTQNDTNLVFNDPTANELNIDVGQNWPTADEADALAVDPSACAASQYVYDINAAGTLACGQIPHSEISSPLTDDHHVKTVDTTCLDAGVDCLFASSASEGGAAETGDNASGFFAAGALEAARGGTAIDSSALTGVCRVAAGTWTCDAGFGHLAAGTAADAQIDGSAERDEVCNTTDLDANCLVIDDSHDHSSAGSTVTIAAADIVDDVALGTDTSGNFMDDVSCGAGIDCTHTPSEGSTATIVTNSSEADFLANGVISCGASTQGKMQVQDGPLQYCDDAATPGVRHAAYGDSSGLVSDFSNAADLNSGGTVNATHAGTAHHTQSHSGSDHTGDVIPDANQSFGGYYSDFGEIAAPADPGAGVVRCYAKTGSGELCCRDDTPTEVCMSSGSGAGDSVSVNGSAVTDADLDDATPTAPADSINVNWQTSGSGPADISANILMTEITKTGTVTAGTWQGTAVAESYLAPGAGHIDATNELDGTICTTNQILEDQGASWACIDTPAGGGITSLGGETGATQVFSSTDGSVTITSGTPADDHDIEVDYTPAASNASLYMNDGALKVKSDGSLTTSGAGLGVLLSADFTWTGDHDFDGETTGIVPTEEVIAAAGTITADACGGVKLITTDDGGQIWTNTTNTFTAPSSANAGCVMYVCNSGDDDNINLDDNELFEAGGNIQLAPEDCVLVASTGTVWARPAAGRNIWGDFADPDSNHSVYLGPYTNTFTSVVSSETATQPWTFSHNNAFAESSMQTLLMLNYLNNAATAELERSLVIQNQDGDNIINGIFFSVAGAGDIETAINASATDIYTAINVGQNDVVVNSKTIAYAELELLDGRDTALVDTTDAPAAGSVGGTFSTGLDLNADAVDLLSEIDVGLKTASNDTDPLAVFTGGNPAGDRCVKVNSSGQLSADTAACSALGPGGSFSFDLTDTDASPILTVDDTEQVQFIGAGTVTVVAADDAGNHDVTITGSAHSTAADITMGGDISSTANTAQVDDVQSATSNLEAADDNTTQVATTSFVQQEINGAGGTDLTCTAGSCSVDAAVARLASPDLTGTPTAPLAGADTDTTQLATTSFVQQEINNADGTDLTCASGTCSVDAGVTRDSGETGAIDFGGASSFEIPNSATPTATTEGQIAMDNSNNGVADGQIIYDDGVGTRVLTDVIQHCQPIEDLAMADDDKPFWMLTAYTDITLISGSCVCVGTCTTTADLAFEIDEFNSATISAVTGTMDCGNSAATDPDQTNQALSGNTNMDQYDVLRFDNTETSQSPETDDYVVCVNYRIVQQ